MSRARHFLIPHEAQKVPLGRAAIVAVFLAAFIFLGYSLVKTGLHLPWVSPQTTRVEALFTNAAGLRADNKPPVSIAGVPAGRVTAVRFAGGQAHVEMQLQTSLRDRMFADATVRVRPLNGANVLSVDILPGHAGAGPLPAGRPIPAAQTAVPVAADEFLSTLDADTRASLDVILAESSIALKGRGGDVSAALQRLAKLTDPAARVTGLISRRRTLTKSLVTDLSRVFATLGRRRAELARTLDAGGRLVSVSARNSAQVAAAVRALPATLTEADRTLTAFRQQATPLTTALERLTPATKTLAPALRATRALLPDLMRLVTATGRVVDVGRTPLRHLATVIGRVDRHRSDLVSAADNVNTLFKGIDDHDKTLTDVADYLAGLTSRQDDRSVLGAVRFLGIEPPKPANFGLAPGTPQATVDRQVARALDHACIENVVACSIRLLTPGLPGSVVTRAITAKRRGR